jgi:virginiamycin B lyase
MYRFSRLVLSLVIAGVTFLPAADNDVAIKEWDVATPNALPHDPAVAPDRALWYTGQAGNLLGRLDPATGQIREYPLRTPSSGPHGLVADNAGSIWFTANARGYIGKLNPQTAEIAEYPIPDSQARDPHTPIFDQKGTLWFTVQNGNFVGRLDPQTGVVTLRQSPTTRSLPYGIVVNSVGFPFFCEFGTNKIGRIDPDTFQITEYVLPVGARPRRIAVTPSDILYYTDYARGFLGRLDAQTGGVLEWPSPAGRNAQPYGITSTPDGKIWYSESGVQPNTIVRFDPDSATFKTWPVPSGGGVIRNMASTPEGNVYIACSGVNKVGIVYPSGLAVRPRRRP